MISALTRWKIGLYLLAIFAAGAVSGWMVESRTARQKISSAQPAGEVGREMSKQIASSFRARLHSKLNLSPDQARQIDAVLDCSSHEIQREQGECVRKIRQGLSNRNAQIAAILTPEQRQQFEQMEKEHQDWGRSRGTGAPSWRHGPRDRDRKTTNISSRIP